MYFCFFSRRRFIEEKNKEDKTRREAEEKAKVKTEIEVKINLINVVIPFVMYVCVFYARMNFQYWFIFLPLLMHVLETNL